MKFADHFVLQLPFFLLGFSSILPLVNPIGAALIVQPYFQHLDQADRRRYSMSIALYALIMGLGAVLLGSWCLRFMGISIPATQIAGGFIVSTLGLSLLNPPKDSTAGQNPQPKNVSDSIFYPLAFPLTLGPGCISALIGLSAHAHTPSTEETWIRLAVVCLALLSVCILTFLAMNYSSLILRRVGPTGSVILNRLLGFLVFCVGIQMMSSGFIDMFPKLLQ